MVSWRECLPLAYLQLMPCLPSSVTISPHGHLCGRPKGAPSLRPHAIRIPVLSSFKPIFDIGIAFNQSEECSLATAFSLALSAGRGCFSSRSLYLALNKGASHRTCTDSFSGCKDSAGKNGRGSRCWKKWSHLSFASVKGW